MTLRLSEAHRQLEATRLEQRHQLLGAGFGEIILGLTGLDPQRDGTLPIVRLRPMAELFKRDSNFFTTPPSIDPDTRRAYRENLTGFVLALHILLPNVPIATTSKRPLCNIALDVMIRDSSVLTPVAEGVSDEQTWLMHSLASQLKAQSSGQQARFQLTDELVAPEPFETDSGILMI